MKKNNPNLKGSMGRLYESAKESEANRTAIRDQVLSNGPPGQEEKGGIFVSTNVYGRAIDEVDPFVFEDTFCVLSKKFSKSFVFRFSASRSLFIFGPLNSLRRLCVFIITHQFFDLFIILAIIANCIAIAFDNNELVMINGVYETKEYNLPQTVELTFLAVYTFEMTVKIIAKGLVINRFSYLRSGWNVLDFFVVVCGFVTEVIVAFQSKSKVENPNLDILRTFRVLRALKTISILPGLRMMINALLNSMVQLIEVMALTFFCLCIFALFALEVYTGKLHQICVLVKGSEESQQLYKSPILEPIDPNTPDKHHLWKLWVTNRNNWVPRDFPKKEYTPCANETGARPCPPGYICLPNLGDNPDDGWTSFDSLLESMLSTFQLITLDFWERLYELVMSTVGPWCVPFFIVVVFLGSFYLLNLMLAVVTMSYDAEAQSWQQKPLSKHQNLALHRSHSTFSFDDPRVLNVTIMTQFRKRTPSEREILARTLRNAPLKLEEGMHESLTNAVMDILGKNLVSSSKSGLKLLADKRLRGPSTEEEIPISPSKVLLARWRSAALNPIRQDDLPDITREEESVIDIPGKPKMVTEENSSEREPTVIRNASGSIIFAVNDQEFIDNAGDVDEDREEEEEEERVERVSTRYSEGGISIMSTDLLDDTDQYSNSTASEESNEDRVRPESYNIIQKALKTVRHNASPYVTSWSFEASITACILLNTILLATEHDHQPDWLTECLNTSSDFFTTVFVYECAFKILVLQKDYFGQNWNIFDLVIVCTSSLDVFIDTALPGGNTIRSFRLLRIFKLAQSWITMKVLLNIIFSTFGALGNLTLVLVIVIYIFAILGMQIVGNKYIPKRFGVSEPDDPNFPRWNFQDFWYAFMMVFRVLCGEWIEPLWDCLIAHKEEGEWKCFIIFLPILIVGNFIILNLFLALLLNSFNTEELKAQREKEKETSGKTDNLKRVVTLLRNRSKRNSKQLGIPIQIPTTKVAAAPNEITKDQSPLKEKPLNPPNHKFKLAGKKIIQQNRKQAAERAILRAEAASKKGPVRFNKTPRLSAKRVVSRIPQKSLAPDTVPVEESVPGLCFPPVCYSLDCLCCSKLKNSNRGRWGSCRKWSLKIVAHPFFEWGILVLILASSITLCFEDIYLEQNADLKLTLFVLNNFFTFLFIIEMILKWMALGMYEYFTTFWTLLDIFIVTVSVITLIFDIQNQSWNVTMDSQKNLQGLEALKALRTLRALRPLRAISRWQGMKVVVNALMYAIPSIFNVLLVCLIFWLVFAIMGVQFYKGKFYKCIFNNNGSDVHFKIVSTMEQCCERNDTSWINTTPNFDNVFGGYLSLFQVATFEGWIELMKATTDADPDDINMQSVRDQSFPNYAFFVVFIVFGSFFTLNLFIGVIIDNFNMLKKKYEGNLLEVLLTPSQRRYYTAMKKLGRKKPRRVIRRPTNRFFELFYDISMSRRFEIAIFVLILLNMILMSFEHHNQRLIFVHILAGCNSFFSTIYALEAAVKILGLRHYYFTVPWNVFDFCLVLFSILDLFIVDSDLKVPFPPTLLRVVRVFRIGRVLRLIKAAKGIRKLLFALIVSLPALFNIGALLALITFIYAILGMALFKDAPVIDNAIDDVFSFQTFAKSSLMLFRLMTAAGWNEVLDALLIEEPICGLYRKMICGQPGEPECISRVQSVFYMVSYIIISFLIVINMYIAIILENFVEANRDEEVGIIEDDLEMFYVRWSRFDPTASQFIVFDQLSEFLASLDPPLNIPKPNLVAIVSFNLPIARGNKIHCLDILHALVKHVLGHVDDSDEFRKIQEQMEQKFRKQFPSRKSLDIVSSTRVWKIQHNAALIIQKAWRYYRKRMNPPPEKSKSIQTMRSGGGIAVYGFGNMMNRMNNMFHHPDLGRRRRSSVKNPSILILHQMTMDKNQDPGLTNADPNT